jgi:hypothetical protein
MAGLSILKHTFDLYEELCVRWLENPYFQFFCGEEFFCHFLPRDMAIAGFRARAVARISGCRTFSRRQDDLGDASRDPTALDFGCLSIRTTPEAGEVTWQRTKTQLDSNWNDIEAQVKTYIEMSASRSSSSRQRSGTWRLLK